MIKEILVFILRFLFFYTIIVIKILVNDINKNKKIPINNIFLFIKDPVLHKNKDNKNGLTIT